MSDNMLVFGRISDILFAKKFGVDMLRAEINKIDDEYLDEYFCKKYCKRDNCDGCPSDKDCNLARKELESEIAEITKDILRLEAERGFFKPKSHSS